MAQLRKIVLLTCALAFLSCRSRSSATLENASTKTKYYGQCSGDWKDDDGWNVVIDLVEPESSQQALLTFREMPAKAPMQDLRDKTLQTRYSGPTKTSDPAPLVFRSMTSTQVTLKMEKRALEDNTYPGALTLDTESFSLNCLTLED